MKETYYANITYNIQHNYINSAFVCNKMVIELMI